MFENPVMDLNNACKPVQTLLPQAGAHMKCIISLNRIDLDHDNAGSILKLSLEGACRLRGKTKEAEQSLSLQADDAH
jgi:hypothetical protein